MGQLIIIRGPIGAGKTTLVNALRFRLEQVSTIGINVLKRGMDATGSSNWRRDIALETALLLSEYLMERKRKIIVDIHSASHMQLDGFAHLVTKTGYDMMLIRIEAPPEGCLARVKSRDVPDITYKIDEAMVRRYWDELFKVKSEMVFNLSVMSADNIMQAL